MTSTFRKAALATALLASSIAAIANPVTLHFDGLVSGDTPLLLDEVQGFKFGDTYAYDLTKFSSTVMPSNGAGSDGDTDFVMNRPNSTADATVIKLSYVQSGSPRYFRSIKFDMFLTSNSVIQAFNAAGLVATAPSTGADGSNDWSFGNIFSFDEASKVDRLEFSAERLGFMGLDNMEITLSADNGQGGNVPEPASYALVALALMAAGGASRLRKA